MKVIDIHFFFFLIIYRMFRVFACRLAKLSECGIRRRQLNWLTATKPHCHQDVLMATSITMNEFAPHLVVLGIGAVIAVAICASERYLYSYNNSTQRLVITALVFQL